MYMLPVCIVCGSEGDAELDEPTDCHHATDENVIVWVRIRKPKGKAYGQEEKEEESAE